MTLPAVGNPRFWEERYRAKGDGWELGGPVPPLVRILETDPPPRGRVAVLGCGRGHDARAFAERGYDAVGYDFAEDAVAAARSLGSATFEQRDIFTLPRDGDFDVVWEYTCFCAIAPARRPDYVEVVKGLLRPGGIFLGLFYPLRGEPAGPPFPVTKNEIRRLFSKGFRWVSEENPPDSIERRRGAEWLVRLTREP